MRIGSGKAHAEGAREGSEYFLPWAFPGGHCRAPGLQCASGPGLVGELLKLDSD